MSFLTAAAALLGAGITLWGSYYLLVGLMSWRRPMEYGRHPASTRFAVLVPARNEELVVGSLINTLLMQDYPPELYDIWVVPNQCTDHTALAARRFGAHVLECTVPVKSKGEVLRFAWERLAHRGYDAVCVFDADNLADPQFLREMNNAYRAGARVAQGFRDSKNPYDSVVSGCYSIYYWMMDRLHNGGRAGLGLPAMINGTGFMVAASVLERMGGWRTETISEDLELSVQCALEEVQVFWVPKAVTYDEQPLTFRESVDQRDPPGSRELSARSGAGAGGTALRRGLGCRRHPAVPGLPDGGAGQSGGLCPGGGPNGAGRFFAPAVRGGRGGQPGHCRPGGHAPGGPCADGGGEVGPAAGSGPGLLLAVSAQLDPHYHPLHVPKDHRLGGDPAYPEPDSRSGLRKGPGAVNPGGHGNSPAACSRWTLSGGAAVGKKKQCPRRFGAPGALQSVGKD